jgi:hypothetical protein
MNSDNLDNLKLGNCGCKLKDGEVYSGWSMEGYFCKEQHKIVCEMGNHSLEWLLGDVKGDKKFAFAYSDDEDVNHNGVDFVDSE